MTRDWIGYGPSDGKAGRLERLRHYLRLSFYDLRTWISIHSERAWSWVRWNLKGRRG
jgi:hypothetical protein